VDLKMLEETRRHINRLIEEVGRLAESELPPSEFYGELLKRVLAAMAAPAGAVWARTPQGNLQLQFHINMREVGLDRNEQSKLTHDELLRRSVLNPQPIHLLPHSGMGPGEEGKSNAGNPTDFLLLLVPILLNNEVQGFLEVWQSPDRPMNAVPGFLQFMSTMADLAARYIRNQLMGQMAGQQQVWTQLEGFARQIHGSLKPLEVSYIIANEGRRLIDCDRVSVGIRMGRKARVEAVSGCDVVEKRSNLVVLMRKLFDSVIAWGEKLVYNGTKDDSLPPDVLHALDAYLAESNSKLLVVLPLRDEREKESKKPSRSALLMECFEPQTEPQQLVSRLEVVGRHAAPALYNAVEYRRIPMRFLWLPLAAVQEGLGGKGKAIAIGVFLLLVALVSALVLIPYPLKMDSKGQLVPITRRNVYTEVDARVLEISVKPNSLVRPGDNLVRLKNRELEQKIREARPALTGAERLLQGLLLEQQKDSGGLKPEERFSLVQKIAEAQKDRDVKKAQLEVLEGANADPSEPGAFFVKAPPFTTDEVQRRESYRREQGLDPFLQPTWSVLSSDFRENLAGRGVDPSQPLFRIGDIKGGWEVELKIPQKHLYQVLNAYKRLKTDRLDVDLLVRTEPTRTFKGILKRERIGGEATPQKDDNNEAEPVVTAYVSIDDREDAEGNEIPSEKLIPRDLLVTGTEVVAKVRCGNAALGYSLFYGVWEFLCEKVLFVF
jgi:hypothetical protein